MSEKWRDTPCIIVKKRRSRKLWIKKFGPIPDGLWVCHLCDNGLCINLEHCILASPSWNTKDAIAKGLNPGTTGHSIIPTQETRLAMSIALLGNTRAIKLEKSLRYHGSVEDYS
jgi:hypothetical protein